MILFSSGKLKQRFTDYIHTDVHGYRCPETGSPKHTNPYWLINNPRHREYHKLRQWEIFNWCTASTDPLYYTSKVHRNDTGTSSVLIAFDIDAKDESIKSDSRFIFAEK